MRYLTVVVFTNGTMPISTSADTVFVSVDVLQATHDDLRGTSFDRIMGNIRDSSHASLFVNCTIKREIEETGHELVKMGVDQVAANPLFLFPYTPPRRGRAHPRLDGRPAGDRTLCRPDCEDAARGLVVLAHL